MPTPKKSMFIAEGHIVRALCALLPLAAACVASAQSPVPGRPRSALEPGATLQPAQSSLRSSRPIEFMLVPQGILGATADREAFFDIHVIGPPDLVLKIRRVEDVSVGAQRAPALFTLVAPAAVSSTSSATGAGGLTVARPAISTTLAQAVGPQLAAGSSTQALTATLRKRLRFAGVPDFGTRAAVFVDVELEAVSSEFRTETRAFRVAIARDAGPPRINFAGGATADRPVFPPFVASPPPASVANLVKTSMAVQIDVSNFSAPSGALSAEFREAYRVIAEYDDGAKFTVPYEVSSDSSSAASTRLLAQVPNIKRGGFHIHVETPLGGVRDVRQFTFPENTFTASAASFCSIMFAGIDQPALTPSESNFWPPVTFNDPALPAVAACGKQYGEWDDVDILRTTIEPAGVASSKFTRRPARGSIAHNGNMPAFSCSAAGLGSVSISWRAKLKIFSGECPARRVP